MTMDEKFKELLQGLTKWYWSANFPTSYVDERGAGIGRVALDSPGAFNVTWAKYRENLITPDAVQYFAIMSINLSRVQINGNSLDTYASLYSYPKFREFYLRYAKTLPSPLTEALSPAFHEKI